MLQTCLVKPPEVSRAMGPKRDIDGMQGTLQRHRDEMMAFVDGWLQRLELEESQRSKASKGPSARPHPAGGVPKPPPDPPPDDVEGREKSQQQRAMSGYATRMDSYALATFADLQVSEAQRGVKVCCRQHWRVKKELQILQESSEESCRGHELAAFH